MPRRLAGWRPPMRSRKRSRWPRRRLHRRPLRCATARRNKHSLPDLMAAGMSCCWWFQPHHWRWTSFN